MWKQKRSHSAGYVLIHTPSHPYANGFGYVPEHRLVVESKLGIIIDPKTHHVHHIDEDKTNNEIKNLLLLTIKEHKWVHAGWELKDGVWHKPCFMCKKKYPANRDNFYTRNKSGDGKPGCGLTSACIVCSKKRAKEMLDVSLKEFTCVICGKTKSSRNPRKEATRFCSRICLNTGLKRKNGKWSK